MPRALALKRYNCYENMRNTKIQQIIDFREELINQENELNKNKDENKGKKKRKSIVIEHAENLADKQLNIIKEKNKKELADIIKNELDKDLLIDKMEREHKEIMDMELKKNDPEAYKEMKKKEEEEKKKRKQELEKKEKEESSSDESDNQGKGKQLNQNDIKAFTGTAALIQLNDSKRAIEQDKKSKNYEMKQIKIQKKIERLANQHQLELEMEERKKNQKLERIRQNQQTNIIQNYEKTLRIKKIIQSKGLATYQVKNEIKDRNDNRAEENAEFYIQKHDKIEKLRRKEEIERDKLRDELIKKQNKYEKARQDARDIVIKKNNILNDIEKQRIDDIIHAQGIIGNGINKKNCKKLVKKFDDNPYLKEVVEEYIKEKYKDEDEKKKMDKDNKKTKKDKKISDKKDNKNKDENNQDHSHKKKINRDYIDANKNENENKSKNENDENKSENNKQNQSISSNKSKEDQNSMKLTEKEIKEKVNKYKKELLKSFQIQIKREREKEEERKRYLETLTNETDKNVAKMQFGKIRNIANNRLEDEKQRINDKIRIYEYNLRKNNEKMEEEFEKTHKKEN